MLAFVDKCTVKQTKAMIEHLFETQAHTQNKISRKEDQLTSNSLEK